MPKYFIQGKGQIEVSQNDFISEGGEGKVFSKGSIVLKIYSDLKKMIPTAKIQELSVLSKMNNIIIPKDLLLDAKSQVVGYIMDYVKGVPICKLFTNDFRNRNNIQPESINKLVERIIETIVFIHDSKCLLIDGNEMNYMVDNSSYQIPYFIDVNGYQTPSFPATVIMPSIRDWNSKAFSPLTDWYSFAIVSCQLFIGIHPFKGKHPKYKPNQLEDRMRANISVFNKDVSVPATCRDFSYIPDDIREWYIKLFEKGERIPPPKVVGLLNIKQVTVKVIQTTNSFEIATIQEFPDEIVKAKMWNGIKAITTKQQIWINKVNYKISSPEIDVVFTPKMVKPIFVKVEKEKISLFDITKRENIEVDISCQEKMVVGNVIFAKYEGNLFEIMLNEFGEKILPSVKHTWNIMPKSSQVLENIIFQNVLGKACLVIPHPEESMKNSSCSIIFVPELNGYRIIDGKYDHNVCMLTGNKGSVNSKFIIRFNGDKYDIRIVDDSTSINFTVLDNGICISINDDDSIEVFSSDLKSNKVNAIHDPDINQSMILTKDGVRAMFFNQNKLYSLSMKKKN